MRILRVEHPDGGGPGVFGDVAPMDAWRAWEEPPPDGAFDAIVLYGGATNVADAAHEPWLRDELAWLEEHVRAGVPVLGLCLGGQLLAAALGAEVRRSEPPEIGWTPLALTEAGRADPVLSAIDGTGEACQWHSWAFALPDGATALATSDVCLQAFRHGRSVGVQFHPEVDAPTLARWIDGWRADPDAVALGFDPGAAQDEAAQRLPDWSDRGRRLFRSFLDDAVRFA